MKKLVSLMLVTLLLVLSVSALADHSYVLEDWGMTVTLPDNVSAEDASTEEASQLQITVDGREDLAYLMQFFYDENFEGRTFADLTEEELQALADSLAEDVPSPTVNQHTTEDGTTFLTMDSEDGTTGAILYVNDGYVVDVIVAKEGEALTEDEAMLAFALLTTLSFDAAAEEAAAE